jgi:ribosomal protein L11 methylase PrmA
MPLERHSSVQKVPASYRDPSGYVFEREGRIYRAISHCAAADYEFVRDRGVIATLVRDGQLVDSQEVPVSDCGLDDDSVRYVVEHPRINLISYPYEWPFEALKCAALFHLDLQIELMSHGVALSDASAYNVQFIGSRPIFLDFLSLRRYREGEYWLGHRQFCEQFLNPLLLRSLCGVPHNAWLRGQPEGLSTDDLVRLLPRHRLLAPWAFMHLALPVWLQRRSRHSAVSNNHLRPLPKATYVGLLRQLRGAVSRQRTGTKYRSTWGGYEPSCSYAEDGRELKRAFVADFIRKTTPECLVDVGCNAGEYSILALESGAGRVIGLDSDPEAADAAFLRARERNADFTVLQVDLANPSPAQGWAGEERQPLRSRIEADAMLALAVVHHLAIGRNVPLDSVVDWLVGLAPQGIIEFVDKEDSQVQRMLRLREDIFDHYERASFIRSVRARAEIVNERELSGGRRVLIQYQRRTIGP